MGWLYMYAYDAITPWTEASGVLSLASRGLEQEIPLIVPHRIENGFLCLAAAGLVPEPQLSGQTVSDFTIALRSEPPSEA